MNPPRFTHYGLSAGQGSASEVETGRAEFGLIASSRGQVLYWRGREVPRELYDALQKVDEPLREPIYASYMHTQELSEHDSSAS